jgi:hypothetical protein
VVDGGFDGEGEHQVTGGQDMALGGDAPVRPGRLGGGHGGRRGLQVQLPQLPEVEKHAGAHPGPAPSVGRSDPVWRPVLPVGDGIAVGRLGGGRVQGHQRALGVPDAVEHQIADGPARAARRQPGLVVPEGSDNGREGLVGGTQHPHGFVRFPGSVVMAAA